MRKNIIFLIYSLLVFQVLYAQYKFTPARPIFVDDFVVLDFPYLVDDGVKKIYESDTPLAVDILEVIVDGKKLSYTRDDTGGADPTAWIEVQDRIPNRSIYTVRTFWRVTYNGHIIWNDGQGMLHKKIPPNYIEVYTNSYEIYNGIQAVKVRYRIRLPMILTKGETFCDETNFFYSDEYSITFDMSKIWEVIKPKPVRRIISDPELEKQLMAMSFFGFALNDTFEEVKEKMGKEYGRLRVGSGSKDNEVIIYPFYQDFSGPNKTVRSEFFDGTLYLNSFWKKDSALFSYLKELIPYKPEVETGEISEWYWGFETVSARVVQEGDEFSYFFFNRMVR